MWMPGAARKSSRSLRSSPPAPPTTTATPQIRRRGLTGEVKMMMMPGTVADGETPSSAPPSLL